MVKFGERMKAARTAKHMSQQALADIIGKSLNTVGLMSAVCVSRVWKRCAFWRIRWRFPATISSRARTSSARRRFPAFPKAIWRRAWPESKIIWG